MADELANDAFLQEESLEYPLISTDYENAVVYNLNKYAKTIWWSGKADTVDRIVSAIAVVPEVAGYIAGGIPGFLIAIVEEAIEALFKVPVYKQLLERGERREALTLFGKEAISFIPAFGDWYDIATNIYTDAAKQMIIRASRETLYEKIVHDRDRIDDAIVDRPGREYDFWDEIKKGR
ncbi:MAG: hypothetical protein V3S89_03990 [Desulfobacterales bacterium]